MSTTPILGLLLPTVNGDNNTWGTKLNTDLTTVDSLGAGAVANVSSNFSLTKGVFPEAFYRVTTGGLTIAGTLPGPGTIPVGKMFTVILLDVGTVVLAAAGAIIGPGTDTSYTMSNVGQYVRLLNNGASYDVVGGN